MDLVLVGIFFRGLLWIGIYCSFLGICVGFILEIKGF